MDFDAAVAYLDAHDNLERKPNGVIVGAPAAGHTEGLSLDRIRGVVNVLGDPQDASPVIHITGTNGKGSTARMISALLVAHGLTVGTYSSPHLDSVTERICRNTEPISNDAFAEVMSEIAALDQLFPVRPNYFDLLTATAFAWFAREAVDVQVIEVGALGRYDSTNIAHADVAVITNVGRDHTDGVGDWRTAVATEKAGIIEDRSAVVIGETDPALVEIFRAEGGALHWVRGEHFGVRGTQVALGGRQIDIAAPATRLEGVYLPLHGAHQADNAALAVAAVEAFFGRGLERDVVAEAFLGIEMPGRFEVLGRQPLVVADGAHNVGGAGVFVATALDEFTVVGATTLVLGCLRRADQADVVGAFLRLHPDRVICVAPESTRAVEATELRDLVIANAPDIDVAVAGSVAAGVELAVAASLDDDAVLVTGSLYTVAEARRSQREPRH